MSKFLVTRRLNLSFLGEGWEECYIDVTPFGPLQLRQILEQSSTEEDESPKAALKSMNETQERLKEAFVSGKGYTGSETVHLEARDIEALPMEVSKKLSEIVMGSVDPNSDTPSTR